jgi:uncharacterized damage-inducible protein DinB
MKMTDLLLAELAAEAPTTRRLLERVPEGKNDWKPHPKSMAMGYLAALVARMPAWVAMTINQDELDLKPADGSASKYTPTPQSSSRDLVRLFDQSVEEARTALKGTTDAHLLTTRWRLLIGGHVVSDQPRHEVLRSSINHFAHHRGQLTVYLRLNDAPVPSIYGPTADERSFG